MAYSSVRKKVANALIAYNDLDSNTNHIKVTREDLAAIAGTAKETLIRTSSDYKSEGLIEIDNKVIAIIDASILSSLIG